MSEVVAEGIISAASLRKYIDAFTTVADEARIHFNDDGLRGRMCDPANVAMVNAELSTDAFESYDAVGSVTIGVNLHRVADRIGPADGEAPVHLAVDMETRKLNVEYANVSHTVSLIDPEAIRKEPDLPNLELPNWVTVEGRQLADAVTHVDMVTDQFYLYGRPDDREVVIVGEGDTDDTTITFDDDRVLEADVTEPTESVFSLDYVGDLSKPIPAAAELRAEFGNTHPIRLQWSAIDGALAVKNILAPRIKSD